MTTNKELQNLYDLRFSIKDLKAEFERNPLTKSRFGSLILTKLDEAYHWARDLTDEIETRDLKEAKKVACTIMEKFKERQEQARQVLEKANAPKTGE